MTTTTKTARQAPSVAGTRVLVVAAAVALLVGVGLALVGALTQGATAAYGALAGATITVGVLWSGSVVVNVIAGLSPSLSMPVALLTYLCQILGIALVFVALSDVSSAGTINSGWVAGAVIAITVTWLVAQIVLHIRQRIPAYDLTAPPGQPVGREGGADGSDR